MSLETLQNSLENTCVRVSFWIKLHCEQQNLQNKIYVLYFNPEFPQTFLKYGLLNKNSVLLTCFFILKDLGNAALANLKGLKKNKILTVED